MQKHTWDTRTWLVGLIGGSAAGSLAAGAVYPPVRKQLDNLPPLPYLGGHTSDILSEVSAFLAVLVLPAVLSGLARRLTFLWGLLPLVLFFALMEVEDWIESGLRSVTQYLWIFLAVLGVCLVVSSGPVSLIRWLRVRAARRHAALLASYQAQRGAASEPQEGVWPPPPEYRE